MERFSLAYGKEVTGWVRYMAVLGPAPGVGRCRDASLKGMWWHRFQGQIGAPVLKIMWWQQFCGMCGVSDFWEMCGGTSFQGCMWVSDLGIVVAPDPEHRHPLDSTRSEVWAPM